LPGGRQITWRSSAPGERQASQWHREFGLSAVTQCLAIVFQGPHIETTFTW
jgi:hypothetical protein